MNEAAIGIGYLMNDLIEFCEDYDNQISSPLRKPWKIIFASGTGTMAFFAYQALHQLLESRRSISNIEIIAVPCVGNDSDLKVSFDELSINSSKLKRNSFPTMLTTTNCPKRIFAKPYKDHLDIWKHIKLDSGIDTFDLVYAPRAFEILLSKSYYNDNQYTSLFDTDDYNLLYYHCGGIEGNESQLQRYKYNNII